MEICIGWAVCCVYKVATPKRRVTKNNNNKFILQLRTTMFSLVKHNINLLKHHGNKQVYVYLLNIFIRLRRDKLLHLYHNYPLLFWPPASIKIPIKSRRISRVLRTEINRLQKKTIKKFFYHNYFYYSNIRTTTTNFKYSIRLSHHGFSLYDSVYRIGVQ